MPLYLFLRSEDYVNVDGVVRVARVEQARVVPVSHVPIRSGCDASAVARGGL
jgi:hypothetical protein